MPKQNDYTLTEAELKQVVEALNNPMVCVVRRALVLHSLHLGYPAAEVARMQGLSLATVYNYFKRFKCEGIRSLVDKPKSGRPPKATKAYRQAIRNILATNPEELGASFTIWTLPSLQEHLQRKTGIKLSQNRLPEVLQEEGCVYSRQKKDWEIHSIQPFAQSSKTSMGSQEQ